MGCKELVDLLRENIKVSTSHTAHGQALSTDANNGSVPELREWLARVEVLGTRSSYILGQWDEMASYLESMTKSYDMRTSGESYHLSGKLNKSNSSSLFSVSFSL
jgi:hypothetical protein